MNIYANMEARVVVDDGDIKIIRYEAKSSSSIRILVQLAEEASSLKKTKRGAQGGKEATKWDVERMDLDEGGVDEERGSDDYENDEDDDPVERVGEDMMRKIMGCLDARSLARALGVSRSWFSIASHDSLWSPLCEQLWTGKAHIPRWSKVPGLSKVATYSRAIMDSKRVRIMREDLCDHAWSFHFTEGAPDYWKDLDPYWGRVGPSMHRHFHPDGSITADPEDDIWGGHESSYTIITGVYGDGSIRKNYVRINRWPHLRVSRREDWGWEMSNSVCSYSSVPDASKEGGTGPMFDVKEHLLSSDQEILSAAKFRHLLKES